MWPRGAMGLGDAELAPVCPSVSCFAVPSQGAASPRNVLLFPRPPETLFPIRFGSSEAHFYSPYLHLAEHDSCPNYSAAVGAPAEAFGGQGGKLSEQKCLV